MKYLVLFSLLFCGCQATPEEIKQQIKELEQKRTTLAGEVETLQDQKNRLELNIGDLQTNERVLQAHADGKAVRYLLKLDVAYYKSKIGFIAESTATIEVEVSKRTYDSVQIGSKLEHKDGWAGSFQFKVTNKEIKTE